MHVVSHVHILHANWIHFTFEVHQAVSVEVDVSEDLVDLSVGHLFSHQLLHGLTELSQTDLTVAIRVELDTVRDELRVTSKPTERLHLHLCLLSQSVCSEK